MVTCFVSIVMFRVSLIPSSSSPTRKLVSKVKKNIAVQMRAMTKRHAGKMSDKVQMPVEMLKIQKEVERDCPQCAGTVYGRDRTEKHLDQKLKRDCQKRN